MKKFWFRSRFSIYSLVTVVLIGAGDYFYFMRQPVRSIPRDANVLVSPANGEVISLLPWSGDYVNIDTKYKKAFDLYTKDVWDSGYIINIMLRLTDVHYQRASTDARLLTQTYVPGNFFNVISNSQNNKILFENEHNAMLFQAPNGMKYMIVQLAWLVARTVVSYLQPGQEVKQGDIIGLIKLGSQVTLIVPGSVELDVKVGDRVVDGESVIGRME